MLNSTEDEDFGPDNSYAVVPPRAAPENFDSPIDRQTSCANGIVVQYLLGKVPEFRRLSELRQMGWESRAGDEFFRKQRKNADHCNGKVARYFYSLMQRIAEQLDTTTGAFQLSSRGRINILDLCMAPGGFLEAAVKSNPGSRARCFSLPTHLGGHRVLMPRNPNVDVEFLDITMLAEDMGVAFVPDNHPDAKNFQTRHLTPSEQYDLVICDGQVLRTHMIAPYRETKEARRLTASQLALGLEHLKPGGTMVVLLHKVEAWATVSLLRHFRQFSTLKLFKPTVGHAKRSSFYMVASEVQSLHPKATEAIKWWKRLWKEATFGTDEKYEESLQMDDQSPHKLLAEFGEDLVKLGTPIWQLQAEALANASFIKAGKRAHDKATMHTELQ